MKENLKKFLELASEDQQLAKDLQNSDKETVLRLAKEHGILLTEEDFEEADEAISDEELDAVSGGNYCNCFLGGGGKGGYNQKVCACVGGGGGEFEDGGARCVCVAAGMGVEERED